MVGRQIIAMLDVSTAGQNVFHMDALSRACPLAWCCGCGRTALMWTDSGGADGGRSEAGPVVITLTAVTNRARKRSASVRVCIDAAGIT
jgi:hypothetical protein